MGIRTISCLLQRRFVLTFTVLTRMKITSRRRSNNFSQTAEEESGLNSWPGSVRYVCLQIIRRTSRCPTGHRRRKRQRRRQRRHPRRRPGVSPPYFVGRSAKWERRLRPRVASRDPHPACTTRVVVTCQARRRRRRSASRCCPGTVRTI